MATITSRTNPKIKLLRAALEGQRRLSEGLVAIEGPHLIAEAQRSGIALHALYVREDATALADSLAVAQTVETHILARDVFDSVAGTQASQGIAALLRPVTHSIPDTPEALLLLLDGIQDPGNLGTLVRSAEAFGASGVLTLNGTAGTIRTVDPWNGKALRASAGSIFRLPIEEITLAQLNARFPKAQIFATVPSGGTDPAQANLRSACILAVGNEGAGVSEALLQQAHGRLTIPCPGPVESLNAAVAGSVLLYAASQQRAAR